MKNKTFNLVIAILSAVALIGYVFSVEKPAGVFHALFSMIPGWLTMGLVLILAYWFLEGYGLYLLCKKLYPDTSLKSIITVAVIGQYFNCITPFASGGQPIQAYYMTTHSKIPIGSAATALLSKFIVYQGVLTVYSIFVLIFKYSFFMEQVTGFAMLALIGFIVNIGVFLLLISVILFPKAMRRIVYGLIDLLAKPHWLKNPEGKKESTDRELQRFYENWSFLMKNKMVLLRVSMVTVLQLTAYLAIPYTIYRGFGLHETTLFTMIAAQAFVMMISSFVPLPGAMGAAEGSFYFFFSLFFPASNINVSLLCWRFFTFYLPILVGMVIVFGIDHRKKKMQPVQAN